MAARGSEDHDSDASSAAHSSSSKIERFKNGDSPRSSGESHSSNGQEDKIGETAVQAARRRRRRRRSLSASLAAEQNALTSLQTAQESLAEESKASIAGSDTYETGFEKYSRNSSNAHGKKLESTERLSSREQDNEEHTNQDASQSAPTSRRSTLRDAELAELGEIREILRLRRLSRESTLVEDETPQDPELFPGVKALRLAIQEHELPMRLAYKQLDELAANAERVKLAIEQNRCLLLLQVKKNNLRYLRSAFTGWMFYTEEKTSRKKALEHLKLILNHGLLSRAFKSWCQHVLRFGKFKRLQVSVERVLKRHCLRRIWQSWSELVTRRQRKEHDQRREKRLLQDIDGKLKENLGRRAANAMHRNRLARMFFAFQESSEKNTE